MVWRVVRAWNAGAAFGWVARTMHVACFLMERVATHTRVIRRYLSRYVIDGCVPIDKTSASTTSGALPRPAGRGAFADTVAGAKAGVDDIKSHADVPGLCR